MPYKQIASAFACALLDSLELAALERLASFYGETQRAMLERLIVEAERAAVDQVSALPNGQADYYDKRVRIEPADVTR